MDGYRQSYPLETNGGIETHLEGLKNLEAPENAGEYRGMKSVKVTIAAAFSCLLLACTAAGGGASDSPSPPIDFGAELTQNATPDTETPSDTPTPTSPGEATGSPASGSITDASSAPVGAPTPADATATFTPGSPGDDADVSPTGGPIATFTGASQVPAADSSTAGTMFGPVKCEGSGRVTFTYFPLDIEVISSIEPMGLMAGGHVTPVDHIYITHDRADQPDNDYVVRMPADGIVVEVQRMPNASRPDYRIVIAHTCTLFTTFIHTGEPVSELKALIGDLQLGANWSGAFAVKAGQAFADASPSTMDFMVHDADVTLPGFILPDTYAGEPWKIHTLDPFDFYDEPLRSQALAFNPRTAEPRGGKIDYDIDGRLVGNWFVEESGGYKGNSQNYWETHLAIAYDHIDPTVLVISIGADTGIPENACNVCAGAFGIKGNSPDPATIGISDGLVKYELIGRIRPAPGAPVFNDENNSLGVFLVEMIDDRSVRVEVRPGVVPSAVAGFTSAAVVYTR